MGNNRLRLDYHLFSTKGGREHNEDCIETCVLEDRACFIVNDGLGGHGKGEVASAVAAAALKDCFEKHVYHSFESAFSDAEEKLRELQKEDGSEYAMKTTSVVLTIEDDTARWFHIGDSRLYLFQKNKLLCRTLDHSVPQMLVMAGEIKEKEIRFHPDRNRLLKALGSGQEAPMITVSDPVPIQPGQTFLLCTDGFWERVDEKKMIKLLKRSSSMKEWIERMTEYVLSHGSVEKMDNASAVGVMIVENEH